MHINFSTGNDEHPHQTLIFDRLLSPAQALSYQCAIISDGALKYGEKISSSGMSVQ